MHNAQPWRFRHLRRSGEFQLRADPERVLPHADPDRRALHLGCGAALFNLRVALARLGRRPGVRLLPDPSDPDLLATVRAAPARSDDGTGELAALHPAIPERHSSRYPFEETPVPEELRAALADAAREEGAELAFPSPWHLEQVLDLMAEAEVRNKEDRGSEEDLARWTRPDAESEDAAADGVPGYAFGPRRRGGKAPMRDFTGGRTVAADQGSAEFERVPQLAVLSTPRDRREDWLRAGQAMQRVLLLATREGLSSSFATQALEWSDLRWQLRDPVSGTGVVQVVLRLGYGPKGPRTPRRPVADVLDIEA
ncbi:nitroreductase [Streptomyces sp. SBST2-5]|uniref:Nitroreductase n=2 Tax=Streptomyces composti TaxID=2720025 RepID=A0ABX1A4Q1_9ACTN|nr:nitroreductase family protein [Streptomyces composti]NJP50190.1 nitroreductase [Streptomyces composti]